MKIRYLKQVLINFEPKIKNLVITLKQTNDKHKTILNEKISEFKNLEKINTENVNKLFIKEFENKDLNYDIEILKNDLKEQIKTNKTIIEENKSISEEYANVVEQNKTQLTKINENEK